MVVTFAFGRYEDLLEACKKILQTREFFLFCKPFGADQLKATSADAMEIIVKCFMTGEDATGMTKQQNIFESIRNWRDANVQVGGQQVSDQAKKLARSYIKLDKLGTDFMRSMAIRTGLLPNPYQIFFTEISGKVYTMDGVSYLHTVKTVIDRYYDESRHANCRRFTFAGRQLEDHKTMLDYNIFADSTLHCV